MIQHEVFKGLLVREQKRADRSNQPLFLLLVTSNDRQNGDGSPIWDATIAALATAMRETDVIGWIEPRNAIGVILTEIQALDVPVARALDARLRRELAKRLAPEAVGRLSIRFHAHPEPNRAEEEGLSPVSRLPLKLPSSEARGSIYGAIKRGLDIVGSLALLGVFSPFLLFVAALVRLTSRGPVFFRQVRVGYMAKPFTMLKFRTMRVDADHALHQEFVTNFIKSTGPVHESGNDRFFKIINDPRVTALGHLLRKTSVDELPQLWNVLRGDMSLVGPRPPLQYEIEEYQPWHRRRLFEARPGLTGLWQVAGRSRTTFEQMVRLDLRYARTCSLSTDLKILLATPAAVISRKGAC